MENAQAKQRDQVRYTQVRGPEISVSLTGFRPVDKSVNGAPSFFRVKHYKEYSLQGVVKVLETAPVERNKTNASQYMDRGRDWDNGIDFDSAVGMIRTGIQDKGELAKLEAAARKIALHWNKGISGKVRKWSEVGEQWDLGRVIDGEQEVYRIEKKSPEANKVVRVYCEMSVSCGVDSTTILRRGAAIYAMVRAIERSGKQVELWITNAIKGCNNQDVAVDAIRLKQAREYVTLPRMAFMLVEPAMFRRIGFKLMETWSTGNQRLFGIFPHNGYGRLFFPEQIGYVTECLLPSEKCIYFPPINGNEYSSDERAAKYIQAVALGSGINITLGR